MFAVASAELSCIPFLTLAWGDLLPGGIVFSEENKILALNTDKLSAKM